MSAIIEDLQERLWLAELWLLEKWEELGVDENREVIYVHTDQEKAAMKLLSSLQRDVASVPVLIIAKTEELRQAAPHVFEKATCGLADAVGFGFYPANATAFVQTLNDNIEHVTARLHDRTRASA